MKPLYKFILLFLGTLAFFLLNLLLGTVKIPIENILCIFMGDESVSEIERNIILSSRVPQALTATVAGQAWL